MLSLPSSSLVTSVGHIEKSEKLNYEENVKALDNNVIYNEIESVDRKSVESVQKSDNDNPRNVKISSRDDEISGKIGCDSMKGTYEENKLNTETPNTYKGETMENKRPASMRISENLPSDGSSVKISKDELGNEHTTNDSTNGVRKTQGSVNVNHSIIPTWADIVREKISMK